MDRNQKTVIFQYQSKKSWTKIAFWTLWLVCLGYMDFKKILVFDLDSPKSILYFIVFHLWGLWCLQAIFWTLYGQIKIELNSEKLVEIKNNGFFKTKTEFELNRINDIEIQKNVSNGYSWGVGIFKIGGFDKEILAFDYNGKWKQIGSKTEGFKAGLIKLEIQKRKKTTPNKELR